MEKEELLKLVQSMNSPKVGAPNVDVDAPTPELSPDVAMNSPELPGAALGLDGGMAPKIDKVAQDEIPTVKTCSGVSTPEGRNGWCNQN